MINWISNLEKGDFLCWSVFWNLHKSAEVYVRIKINDKIVFISSYACPFLANLFSVQPSWRSSKNHCASLQKSHRRNYKPPQRNIINNGTGVHTYIANYVIANRSRARDRGSRVNNNGQHHHRQQFTVNGRMVKNKRLVTLKFCRSFSRVDSPDLHSTALT